MTRNLIIGAVLILALVALGFWITTTQDTEEQPEVAQANNAQQNTPGAAPTKNTFRNIFTQSGNYECKYDTVGENRTMSVIYLADGKMRGEFRAIEGVADLMVYDGSYLYSWKEGKTTGTRTRLSSISELPNAIPTDLTSAAVHGTSDNSVSWTCQAWFKDAKKLAVPAGVTFN